MGAIIYLGNKLGLWLDGHYNKTFLEPLITCIAIFISIYTLIKNVNRLNNDR